MAGSGAENTDLAGICRGIITMTKHGFLDTFVDPSTNFRYNLTGSVIVPGEDARYTIHPPHSASGFIELACNHKLSMLWIVPTYGREMTEAGIAAIEHILPRCSKIEYDFKTFTNKQTKQISSIVGRRIINGVPNRNVNVAYLSQTNWPYENIDQFAGLISGVESKLGVPMKASPTSVGLRYLEKIDARNYARYFADPDVDRLALKKVFAQASKPLIWSRIPTPEELANGLYLVAVDKRAAYPRASMENVGIGKPERYTGPFNHLFPGAWDVLVRGIEDLDPRFPAPLWDGWQAGTLATPVVKMLISLGCEIVVKEALIWRKTAPVFDRWAKGLWEARRDLPALKAVMNNTLGFTVRGEETDDEKFRPDWYAQIVGYLRALMIYNARKIAANSGLYPVGAYIDALYYLSPVPYVPGLTLAPDSMGGYAQKWAIPVDAEVRGLLCDPAHHAHFNMMLHQFNQIGKAA